MDHSPPQKIKVDCPCGCPEFGTPRVKAWRDGLHHVRTCTCKRCLAPGYKRRASTRERQIARDIGGQRVPLSGQGGRADVEGSSTSKKPPVKPWRGESGAGGSSSTIQSKTAALRLLTSRPSALVVAWPTAKGGNVRKRLAILTYEDFVALVQQAARWTTDAKETPNLSAEGFN